MIWYFIVSALFIIIVLAMLLHHGIITSCRHVWVKVKEIDVYNTNRTKDTLPIGHKYVMQCSKCGAVKTYFTA